LLEPAPADPGHVVDPFRHRGRAAGSSRSCVWAGQKHEVGNGRTQQEFFLGTAQAAKVQPGQPRLPFASANTRATPRRSRIDRLNSGVCISPRTSSRTSSYSLCVTDLLLPAVHFRLR
jgi:hypothetical protein